MGSAANTKTSELDELLKAVGDDVIRAYRDKYFPARIVQACPSVYSIENASKWIKFEKFCSFVAQFLQEQSPSPSPSNINLRGPDPDPSLNENQRALTQTKRGRRSSTSTCQTPTADRPTSDTGESDNETGVTVPLKRRRTSSVTKQSGKRAAGMIQVTRQSWVSKVETLTDVPEHWRVPESGDSVAYILDLTADTREWLDSKGKTMTMSAVIKQKCTDAWAGGTGGSLSKATTVTLLGEGVKCQKMSHDCRGVFLCSRAAVDLWKDYKRDSDESDETEFSLQSERNHLVEQESLISHYERPVAFYNSVVKDKCQFDNGRCAGRPEIKKDDIMVLHYIFSVRSFINGIFISFRSMDTILSLDAPL
ncbi:hypothetical protein K439DRAFT_245489 [Ramaria rubella]|nr:hypothetical protein K439DRAFT_245489 [Ramaria rubella]